MPKEMAGFFNRYHKAFVQAVGGDVEKAKSRIASSWVNDWKDGLGRTLEDEREFAERFQSFLGEDLCFADRSDVSLQGDRLDISIEGCAICPGNDLLRAEGKEGLCPLVPTGLFAISRVHRKKAFLEKVEKPGPVGRCTIKYRLGDGAG